MTAERVDVLGVGVHAYTWPELLAQVRAWIIAGEPRTVAYANVHVLNTARRDAALRTFLDGVDACYCDGSGVILGARLLGAALPERMTGADWIWDLAAEAESSGWRIHWIGGEPGVTAAAAEQLRTRHPRLTVTTDHGFHARQGPEDDACLERIRAAQPHIVLVGMGTPIQERWVAAHREQMDAPVVWCLGATADFISGKVDRPGPAWLVENHEWLSRLLADPRRLWQRYLLGNALFMARIARQRLGRKV
ncbi:MAG: N-acetylglucosaminyldiphosphoundecaprenol N-acetyl-beta-D-mannosaminyltransferase [Myxococcota bacterium]|jgi:N-acetylglucosaminyldiphosphoundecaprenol N-acetyl-beta-D-mannosaminyltransferase